MKISLLPRRVRVLEIPLLALMFAFIVSCSSNDGNNGGNGGANAFATVPLCSASDLTPFNPIGSGVRISQIPLGTYNYTGGEFYSESVNLPVQVSIHVVDTDPNSSNTPGTVTCLTIPGGTLPVFDTASYIYRIATAQPSQFNFAVTRALRISSNGTGIQTMFSSDDTTEVRTKDDLIAEEDRRYARGEQIDVYQTGANTYRLVVIRTSTAAGFTAKVYIGANYTKIN